MVAEKAKTMINCDEQREENFQEYLRLLSDPNYVDVCFDEQSGGVSAVHREHQFDKSIGPFGCRRGQYELDAVNVLRQSGRSIILQSEKKDVCMKQCDGLLDWVRCEIKAVEGSGRWAIRTKIYDAAMQGAQHVILLYPNKNLFNFERIKEGWYMYEEARIKNERWPEITRILAIIGAQVIEIEKPPR